MAQGGDRSSRPVARPRQPVLSPEQRARREAENGFHQFDRLIDLIKEGLQADYFRLQTSMIIELNRLAVDELVDLPGAYRQTAIAIDGSGHAPPPWQDVPKHIDDMCEYVNANWTRSPVHLAAYVMWRLNWIHPFEDGNGRTSRAASYLVLSVRLGQRLPGKTTIPDRIAGSKQPYYAALESADTALKRGVLDLSEMERLLSDLVARQVLDAAVSESSRTTRQRGSATPGTTDDRATVVGKARTLWNEHRVALVAALIVALATVAGAIVTGTCTMLSTEPGQKVLVPQSVSSVPVNESR
jgi:fido (protein-threonine AMPylation protein)